MRRCWGAYSKKIEVFAPDKSSGKRVQEVKIYFNFVDDVEIPVISEVWNFFCKYVIEGFFYDKI